LLVVGEFPLQLRTSMPGVASWLYDGILGLLQ
jgi:hypothetical protein